MRLLILGATGKSGQAFTQQAVDRGHEVTVLVRSPQKVTIRHDRLTVVAGDPSTTVAIESALRGHDAVLSALGRSTGEDILARAAEATISAMRQGNVRRLLAISSALLYPDIGLAGRIARMFLRATLRDSAGMERVIQVCDLDWTIVRASRLTDGASSGTYRISSGAPTSNSISRTDVAACVLDTAEKNAHLQRVVGVSA